MNKELDRQLRKKLESEEQKIKLNEIRGKYENNYVNTAIMFFGTLIPLYILFYGAQIIFMFFFESVFSLLGIGIAWILPLIHGAIWIAAVISVFRKRSVFEDIIQRF